MEVIMCIIWYLVEEKMLEVEGYRELIYIHTYIW